MLFFGNGMPAGSYVPHELENESVKNWSVHHANDNSSRYWTIQIVFCLPSCTVLSYDKIQKVECKS